MNPMTNSRWTHRWLIVCVFATAMAWVESAVVFYLRTMIHRINPYQPNPLPVIGELGPVELLRELATLIMLLAVGLLAGRTWRARIAYSAVAFGVWDIFYYIFLKCMCHWPDSLMDWDILFLLPLPWWGPVAAPLLIAGLMIMWGTLTVAFDGARRFGRVEASAWAIACSGMAVVLWVFMADSLRVRRGGVEAIRAVLPEEFNWIVFWFGFACMTGPVLVMLRQLAPEPRLRGAMQTKRGAMTSIPEARYDQK